MRKIIEYVSLEDIEKRRLNDIRKVKQAIAIAEMTPMYKVRFYQAKAYALWG